MTYQNSAVLRSMQVTLRCAADDQVYNGAHARPAEILVSTSAGGVGPREKKLGLCWSTVENLHFLCYRIPTLKAPKTMLSRSLHAIRRGFPWQPIHPRKFYAALDKDANKIELPSFGGALKKLIAGAR